MSEAQAAVAPKGTTELLLEIDGLSAYYGSACALDDVTFSMGHESIAIVGRNGMGKTTLCNAIIGISPPRAEGSILFEGEELVGEPSYKIARRGVGYVPQGRRLFPSLTVDQHLRIASRGGSSSGGASGPASGSTNSFRASPSARGTAAPSSPAVSSRCWPSAGRS